MIAYEPTGPSDRLACQAMVEVAHVLNKPLILGAWMTRLWVLIAGPAMRVRATNDVDVGFEPAVGYVEDARRALEEKGYVQDAGDYRFRFSRMTAAGVLIVDLLVDQERASGLEPALPVYGMAAAAEATVEASLRIAGIGRCEVRMPTLRAWHCCWLVAMNTCRDGALGVERSSRGRGCSP